MHTIAIMPQREINGVPKAMANMLSLVVVEFADKLAGGQRRLLAAWWSHARNQKSVTINLKTVEGRQLVKDLTRECDVLVKNFCPGQMEKGGLGPETIKPINPGLEYRDFEWPNREYTCCRM
jgi:crotonobetainyl-CoA:carnitine CoA-transferase CaiB-like acyl-CoA transferase